MSFSTVHNDGELHQTFLMTKPANQLTRIECTFPSDCYYYFHWYQKKDGEPFKRVQYVHISDAYHINAHGFEFLQSEKSASNKFVLIIPSVKPEHSATYYCACWVWSSTVRSKLQSLVQKLYNNALIFIQLLTTTTCYYNNHLHY